MPALLLGGALVAGLCTATRDMYLYWWLCMAGPLLLLTAGPGPRPGRGGLSLPLAVLLAVLLGNEWLVNPLPAARGLYLAAILGGAYLAAARLTVRQLRAAFHAGLLILLPVALWALLQALAGVGIIVDLGGVPTARSIPRTRWPPRSTCSCCRCWC